MKFTERSLILLILIAICSEAYGKAIDTNSYHHSWTYKQAVKLNLPDMVNAKDGFNFRLWGEESLGDYVIDISKTQDSVYEGSVILYTYEYVDISKEKPTNRIYSNVVNLSPSQANAIYKLIQDQSILQIPTDSVIKGWSLGKDGIDYLIEYTNGSNYTLKSYWTPSAQENINEAKIIQNLIDTVSTIINENQFLAGFSKRIPFESYTDNGWRVSVSRALTEKQRRLYKRERDKYRKQNPTQ